MSVTDFLFLPLMLIIYAALVVVPPVGVWRAMSRPAWRSFGPVLAIPGPVVLAFALIVLISLPGYSGICGGWLGETHPCSGFGEYVLHSLFFTAMMLAVPGLFGIFLACMVLVVGLLRHVWIRRAA